MAGSGARGRALWVAAAVLLALDGAVLLGLAFLSGRSGLAWLGAGLLLGAGTVGWSWRWYRARSAAIARARHDLAGEARAMQDLLRDR